MPVKPHSCILVIRYATYHSAFISWPFEVPAARRPPRNLAPFRRSLRSNCPLNHLASSWLLDTLLATACHAGNSTPSRSLGAFPWLRILLTARRRLVTRHSSGCSVLAIRHPPGHLRRSGRVNAMPAIQLPPENSAPFQLLGVLLTVQHCPCHPASF